MNLHNAGNDAGYTLQALLALAVHEVQNPGGFAREVREGQFGIGRKLPGVRFERGWKAVEVWGGSTMGRGRVSEEGEGEGEGREGKGLVDAGGVGDAKTRTSTTTTTTTTTKPKALPKQPAERQEHKGTTRSAAGEDGVGGAHKRKRKRNPEWEGLGDAVERG